MSTFAWLDYSERQRRRMLEIVDLFREQGTVDELGIGGVRDALSETLFPGTSTLHTRFRYLLFIPWIYIGLEEARVAADQVDRRLKRAEARLIGALEEGGEREGVIGIEARQALQRFPSIVYWNALWMFGMRAFRGSQQQYHRSFDTLHEQRRTRLRSEGDELGRDDTVHTWHPRLPGPPDGFLDEVTFTLRRTDAEYLQERVLECAGDSLLGFLVTQEGSSVDGDFPWECPLTASAPPGVRSHLAHARSFSELMHGAALLYNLLLAEKVNDARRVADSDVVVKDDLTEGYRSRLGAWAEYITDHTPAYRAWSRSGFWQLIRDRNPRLSPRTQHFVDRWVDLALDRAEVIPDHAAARDLVADREVVVKRGLARVANLRALERWSGASGTRQLMFRWPQGSSFAGDVLAGLGS